MWTCHTCHFQKTAMGVIHTYLLYAYLYHNQSRYWVCILQNILMLRRLLVPAICYFLVFCIPTSPFMQLSDFYICIFNVRLLGGWNCGQMSMVFGIEPIMVVIPMSCIALQVQFDVMCLLIYYFVTLVVCLCFDLITVLFSNYHTSQWVVMYLRQAGFLSVHAKVISSNEAWMHNAKNLHSKMIVQSCATPA